MAHSQLTKPDTERQEGGVSLPPPISGWTSSFFFLLYFVLATAALAEFRNDLSLKLMFSMNIVA